MKKYSNIPDRWGVDGDIVYYILRRYEKLLDNEIKNLQKNSMRLPKFFRDRRSDEEYVYDIIDGWVMEDIICDAWLRPRLLKVANNIEIKAMGTNRDRVIQKYDPIDQTRFCFFAKRKRDGHRAANCQRSFEIRL